MSGPNAPLVAVPTVIRVLGIDPGTRLCGWGVIERRGSRLLHVDNGVLVLGERVPLATRLLRLAEALDRILVDYEPDQAAVETVFMDRNPRAALVLGHGRGVALLCLERRGCRPSEYTPQQVKKAVTGAGRASKAQIQAMITQRLGLQEPPQADAADAVAVALCHAQHGALGLTVTEGDPKQPRRAGRRAANAGLAALVARQAAERGDGRALLSARRSGGGT